MLLGERRVTATPWRGRGRGAGGAAGLLGRVEEELGWVGAARLLHLRERAREGEREWYWVEPHRKRQ